jgi:hypothetical protein
MKIKNTFCELKGLTSSQVGHLQMLMPDTEHFNFHSHESLIGFEADGAAGTWGIKTLRAKIVSYKDMLSLLVGEEEEEDKLVPHIHQKEIIAWANGEALEYYAEPMGWVSSKTPSFRPNIKYRVKPSLAATHQIPLEEKRGSAVVPPPKPLKEFIMLELAPRRNLGFGLSVSKSVNFWIAKG